MQKLSQFKVSLGLIFTSLSITSFAQLDRSAGDIHLHVSLPYANGYQFEPIGLGTKTKFGFLGVAAGVDYYIVNTQFLHLGTYFTSDFFIPFPAPVTYEGGEFEFLGSSSMILTNNHHIGERIVIGYGLSYAKNRYNYQDQRWMDTTITLNDGISKSHFSFGLAFSSYYRFSEHFHLGLIYRPTYYRFNTSEPLAYEHVISLDLAWKFRLWRRSSTE
ncbi:MAG: hypothetical protein HWE14_08680 [Flavobacteriia bacterium]|nr:hypothetical protein [Flavobacteriia bacterium]